MKHLNILKKVTMTREDAEKELANFDWSEIASSCNGNIVVAYGNKRKFWRVEQLIACKQEKGVVPTTDLLLAHCKEYGKEYPGTKLVCSITIIARGVPEVEAIKESLS